MSVAAVVFAFVFFRDTKKSPGNVWFLSIVLFVGSAAVFFSFLNNILEIRIDAFKTLTQLRRPLPKKTKDIGIWMPIINAVSKLGILTNVRNWFLFI